MIVRAFLMSRRNRATEAVNKIEPAVGQPDTTWPEDTLDHYYGQLSAINYLLKTIKHPLFYRQPDGA